MILKVLVCIFLEYALNYGLGEIIMKSVCCMCMHVCVWPGQNLLYPYSERAMAPTPVL